MTLDDASELPEVEKFRVVGSIDIWLRPTHQNIKKKCKRLYNGQGGVSWGIKNEPVIIIRTVHCAPIMRWIKHNGLRVTGRTRSSMIGTPKVNDLLVTLTACLHIGLTPEIILVRKVIERSIITPPMRSMSWCGLKHGKEKVRNRPFLTNATRLPQINHRHRTIPASHLPAMAVR